MPRATAAATASTPNEGDAAGRAGVCGRCTPSIDETDDDAAGDENAMGCEEAHTGLLRVRPVLPNAWEYGGNRRAVAFLTGPLLCSTIPVMGGRRMPV